MFRSGGLFRTLERSGVVRSPTLASVGRGPIAAAPTPQDAGSCRFRSNRSRRGLYDGKDIRAGNNVSFSMRATKRTFKPNVFTKRVYSEILDEMIRFHLTTAALRSIDKAGGLDNYLLTSKHVTSGEGKVVKARILEKLAFQERQRARGETEESV